MTMQHSGRDAAKILLDAAAVERTLSRIAHELIERNADLDALALVGIHTRGVPLAYRLRALVEERSGVEVDIGAVDITFHRDDVLVRGGGPPLHAQPVVRGTELDFPLEGKTVVLVDDVLFSGRTIRAAIDALLEYGRPARVQLAVLVDRGPPRAADPAGLRRQEHSHRTRRARAGRARRDRRRRPRRAARRRNR